MGSVREIMHVPISIEAEMNLDYAMKIMLFNNFNRILVSENGNVFGVATMRDVIFFLLYDRSDRKLTEIPISEVTIPLVSIDDDATIKICAGNMLENGFGSLAIRSRNKISGIVTKTDLVRYFRVNYAGRKFVGEYMSPYYSWLYDNASIYDIVRKLYEENITRVIIRTQSETPIGIVTLTDLVRQTIVDQTKVQIEFTEESFRAIFPKNFDPRQSSETSNRKLALDLMSKKIISVQYDEDLAKACGVILDNGINGIGVTSGKGNIIGILSKTDVTRALSYLE